MHTWRRCGAFLDDMEDLLTPPSTGILGLLGTAELLCTAEFLCAAGLIDVGGLVDVKGFANTSGLTGGWRRSVLGSVAT